MSSTNRLYAFPMEETIMGILQFIVDTAPALAGFKKVRVRSSERGLLWKNGEFAGVVGEGVNWYFDPLKRVRVDVLSRLTPWLRHEELPAIVKSGKLPDSEAQVLEILSGQRGLVWLDGRFSGVLTPGRWVWWKGEIDVRFEVHDVAADYGRFDHPELDSILSQPEAARNIDSFTVPAGTTTAFFHNGALVKLLPPGRYAFWNAAAGNKFEPVDTREISLDIGNQDMLTADRLGLRLNVSVSYRVADVVKSLSSSADSRQALYREAQLLLRAAVGARELDALLSDKDSLASELEQGIRDRAARYGLEVTSFGVRDIILPGDIKAILNKVVEAKKASEAATVVRREETAAMRHQLNSARILAENPVLMRLRELEALEKVAAGNKLNVVLGDKGLAERVTTLI